MINDIVGWLPMSVRHFGNLIDAKKRNYLDINCYLLKNISDVTFYADDFNFLNNAGYSQEMLRHL